MIRFFKEDTAFNYPQKSKCKSWLRKVAESEGCRIGDINVIFCSDAYLLDVNRQYLGHDYFTDIITFDYRSGDILSGDLFISVDCVRSNAEYYNTGFSDELDRVIIHGLLHIIGYDDHTDSDISKMRSKEDDCLKIRSQVQNG